MQNIKENIFIIAIRFEDEYVVTKNIPKEINKNELSFLVLLNLINTSSGSNDDFDKIIYIINNEIYEFSWYDRYDEEEK